jgi:hypothetical protein
MRKLKLLAQAYVVIPAAFAASSSLGCSMPIRNRIASLTFALTRGGFLGLPDTSGSGAGLETGGRGKHRRSRWLKLMPPLAARIGKLSGTRRARLERAH